MKRIIFLIMLCSIVSAQNTERVFRSDTLTTNTLTIITGSNLIGNSLLTVSGNDLYSDYKLKIDSIYSNSSTELWLNGNKMDGTDFYVYGDQYMYGSIEIDSADLDILAHGTADSGNVVTYNGTTVVWAAPSVSSSLVIDSTITINQGADGVGLQINGYDDRATDYFDVAINASGYSEMNTSSAYAYFQIGGTNRMYYSATTFALFDNYILGMGSNLDFRWTYDEATDDRLELSDGTNDFLTITDAGTDADFNFIGRIESDGYKINTHTITGDTTIASADMYGGLWYCTGADTVTLPPVLSGMSATFITIGNISVSINPDDADKLYLNAVALDDGDKATNTSTANDKAFVGYFSADGWYINATSWTDGG